MVWASLSDAPSLREGVCMACVFYPLLGGLVAKVQGSGVPVNSYISISYRGSVLCTLYCTASTEPERHTHTHTHRYSSVTYKGSGNLELI